MKTHIVLDYTYNNEIVYCGTEEECCNYISEQNSIGLDIKIMTDKEKKMYNN